MTFDAKLIAVTQPVVEGKETLHDLIAYCAQGIDG